MEDRLANLETNMATNLKTQMQNNMAILQTKLAESVEKIVDQKLAKITANMEGELQAVNNEVKGLKIALVEAFDQMKSVLVKMDGKIEENARKVRNAPSGDRENIIVARGFLNDSVEMFNWRQRTWSPLQSMPKKREGATSFVYNNQIVVAGGYCAGSGYVDDMIRMNVDPLPDLAIQLSR